MNGARDTGVDFFIRAGNPLKNFGSGTFFGAPIFCNYRRS